MFRFENTAVLMWLWIIPFLWFVGWLTARRRAKKLAKGIGTRLAPFLTKSISPKKMEEIEKATDKLAEKIRRNYGHVKPGLKTKAYFEVMRKLVKSGWNEVDVAYWKEHGWTEKARPWK